jgi:hypothetical protein
MSSMPPLRSTFLLLGLAACGSEREPAAEAAAQTAPVAAASQVDARFISAIESAGRDYQRWGRVEPQLEVAIAPCSPGGMVPQPPARVFVSRAPESPHDKKLFYLWASDRAAYTSERAIAQGFAVVKESFRARALPPEQQPKGLSRPSVAAVPIGGHWWTTGEPSGLFVMTKVGAGDGTDVGWVYGTIVDGKVTSAGRVASCAGCHEGATHERLFGLPST